MEEIEYFPFCRFGDDWNQGVDLDNPCLKVAQTHPGGPSADIILYLVVKPNKPTCEIFNKLRIFK